MTSGTVRRVYIPVDCSLLLWIVPYSSGCRNTGVHGLLGVVHNLIVTVYIPLLYQAQIKFGGDVYLPYLTYMP